MAAHTSRTIVGRDDELARLAELVGLVGLAGSGASAAAPRRWQGRPASVLLSGDAGVGKTRVLIELRDLARAEGWRVHAGHCLDFGESALPYLPFSEVIGRFATDQPELLEQVAASHPAIARLQPGRRVRADRAEAATDDPAREVGSSGDRAELFEAVHVLLDAAAAEAPLLVVIEDAHWADQSTRDLLGFLFTRAYEHPVAFVTSYRSDDLHRRHPLRRQVAEWSRIPSVDRVQLPPLPEESVRALVAELAPDGVAEAEVLDIVRRAEGIAFFVEELVASGAGGWVPDDLADLLLVRLDRLSDDARLVVRAASVAGRKVSHELLEAVVALPSERLDAGVRQAVEMNVLLAGGGTYSFRHALLGEAVYDDLLPGERVRLHQQYVGALGSGAVRGTAAELARHARRAMDLDRAATASMEAGDEAVAVGGPDEAARHYEQALELLADGDRASRLQVDLSKMAVKTAEALSDSGDTQRAAELVTEHLRRLPADAPSAARARLLSFQAIILCIVETTLDPVAISAEALSFAPEGESRLRARVLSDRARVLASFHRADEAESAATEALALAERLAMPALASEIITTLSSLGMKGGATDREALRAALRDAVDRAMAARAVPAELRGRFLLGRSHQEAAEWQPAAEWFSSGVERGTTLGLTWAPYALEARWQLGAVHYATGEWESALALVDVVTDPGAPPIAKCLLEPVRLAILAARGGDVTTDLRRLRKVWPDEGVVAVFSGGLEIELAAAAGDAGAALAAYDDVTGLLTGLWSEHYAARLRHAASALAAIARALPSASAAERGRLAARAGVLRADGEAVVERFAEPRGAWGPEGRAWADRLRAEHLRVRWLALVDPPTRDELLAGWSAAVASYEELASVPELAQVRITHASILRLLGETAAAREAGDAARATAHALGATTWLDDLVAAGSAPQRASAGDEGPARLTTREREILALVAEGRSNGEIGRQLFISTKTVSVHVSNILGKLGAAGRTEAAAIARRDGLL